MNPCGWIIVACSVLLPITGISYAIYAYNTLDAKNKRAEEKKKYEEALQQRIELATQQQKNYESNIDKTYIISIQERTVDAKYLAIGGYGQLNKTVQNTTTFLIVLKDGTKKTDEVPDRSYMYNVYLQHLDTSNLNGGKA